MTGFTHHHVPADALTAALAAAPPHLAPVLVAVRDHKVGLLSISQGSGPFAIPAEKKKAAVVIVGDDMDVSMGPNGFHVPSIRRLIRACRGFAVISSAPPPDLYATMAAVAVGGCHALIVETRLEHEFRWIEMIQKLAPRRPLIVSTIRGGTA